MRDKRSLHDELKRHIQEALGGESTNVAAAINLDSPGSRKIAASRQRITQRNGSTEVTEIREERSS